MVRNNFLYFSISILCELIGKAILMSTHNMFFVEKCWKLFFHYHQIFTLCFTGRSVLVTSLLAKKRL